MNIVFIVLSITLVQLPAIVLRYLPFSKLITSQIQKRLLVCYILCFLIQHAILYFYFSHSYLKITPLSYKRFIFVSSLFYVLINIILIKDLFFQHLFVFGMQGGYSLILHSIVAYFLGIFGSNLSIDKQFIIQTSAYIILFTFITVPIWKRVKSSFVLKRSVKQPYYWNIIWLIPALAVYSDVIVTMNNQWIYSWQQIASRMMTGFAIFISWKCIDLDFKALEEILTLRNTNKLLKIQEVSIHNQANILEENDKKIRILKHDMRHHLQLLSTLIEQQNYLEATNLISHLNNSLQSTKPIIYCKNKVINSALLVYINMAQEHNIEVVSEIDIPETIPWNSNDIGILFANTLENAVIASLKQHENNRKIHIITRYDNQTLVIAIKNRFDGEVHFDKNGSPIAAAPHHGVGLLSINSIANKYSAHVTYSLKNGWFSISFLFSNSSTKNIKSIY